MRFRGWIVSGMVLGLGCTAGSDLPQTAEAPTVQSVRSALSGPLQNDFEDGTTQGWFPFGSPTVANSTDVANTGTHSLLTTNRTATFMGPGTSLTGQLTAGATYSVSVAARLTAGESPTTLNVTVMRTLSDGSNNFDPVTPALTVTADGWTTLTGTYSFNTSNVTGLIMYVESASATASYYIDSFSLKQSAPAPIA
ncbi:MAG TPA: carbohydrate binding domain-containing protein, partial [Polyangia bacterium]|nr:carbohydrate binding domain-containing protein [Polyangia bacterium]